MAHTGLRPFLLLLAIGAATALALPGQDVATKRPPINTSLLRPDPEPEDPAPRTLAQAFAAARAAVVHVYVEVAAAQSFKLERPSSGVIVAAHDGQALVLTHWNLVREAEGAADKSVHVQLGHPERTVLPAEIVAHDAHTGLALVRVKVPDGVTVRALPLQPKAPPGSPAAVLGFADGEDHVAFAGVVTPAQGEVTIGDGGTEHALAPADIVLTDAVIQRRSHGAALLGPSGGLIGICNADRVLHDVQEPTLAELKRPSFGFAVGAAAIQKAFAAELAKAHAPAAAAPPPSPEASAVAAIAPAVVAVHAGAAAGDDGPPPLGTRDPYASQRHAGVGSGVVVDPRGLVLTNRHLVDGARDVRVRLASGKSFRAKVLRTDTGTSSALLRVDVPDGDLLPAARLGDPAALRVGDPLLVVGNPRGGAPTVGLGVLSAHRGRRLQTDAPIGNQNGGGAIVDARGFLVGMSDAGAVDAIDLAYAMRGDHAKVDTGMYFVPALSALRRAYRKELGALAGDDAEPTAANDDTDSAPATVPASTPYSPLARLVERAGPSMLNIYIEVTSAPADLEENPFATEPARTAVESLGSGVIIDQSGLALTNWHVVDSATEPSGEMVANRVVRAALRDGRKFAVRVLSISREEDLALLQLELEPGTQVAAVRLGSSEPLQVGEPAVAIGNPLGVANTVTAGVVTAKNQAIRVRGRWAKLPHLIETDAAINGGNSGGALLDVEGRLIGINSAGGSLTKVTSYAISVDHVRRTLHAVLLSPQKLRSPWIGVTVVDADDGTVRVQSVDPFGPGAAAGLREGDQLVALDGAPVRWSLDWILGVLRQEPDAPFAAEVRRDGRRQAVKVTPMSAPAWAVLRQTDLVVAEVDEAKLVREAALAFHRAVTGDPEAAPSMLPRTLVRVEKLHPSLGGSGVDVQVGDLLLGVQLTEQTRAGDVHHLLKWERIVDVRRCFDDYSSYEGRRFKAWIWRDGAVKAIELPAKRLIL